MEGCGGEPPEEVMPAGKFGRYEAEVEERIQRTEKLALRSKGGSGKHLEVYGGLRKGIGMKTYLHGPMTFAKKQKLRFCVSDLNLPEKQKRYSSSREEEEVDAQMCPCGKAIERKLT